jgi:putative drug exporter of the RND superfamily
VAGPHDRGRCRVRPASDALNPEFSVPGNEGWETNQAIAARYGDTGGDNAPLVPVVTLHEGKTVDSPGVRRQLVAVDDRLREALPGSRIASFASTGDRTFVSDDGGTTSPLRIHDPIRGRSGAKTPLRRRQPSGRWGA